MVARAGGAARSVQEGDSGPACRVLSEARKSGMAGGPMNISQPKPQMTVVPIPLSRNNTTSSPRSTNSCPSATTSKPSSTRPRSRAENSWRPPSGTSSARSQSPRPPPPSATRVGWAPPTAHEQAPKRKRWAVPTLRLQPPYGGARPAETGRTRRSAPALRCQRQHPPGHPRPHATWHRLRPRRHRRCPGHLHRGLELGDPAVEGAGEGGADRAKAWGAIWLAVLKPC